MKNLLLLLLLSYAAVSNAQFNNSIYKSFVAGNMKQWKTIMTEFANNSNLSNQEKLELVSYYYGYTGYVIGEKNKKEAKIYIEKADTIINNLIITNPTATVYAYKGAFLGYKIALAPYKAPILGISSSENVNKALAIDANNVQANIEKGNILYFSPSIFGGNKNEAKKCYSKAIQLIENDASLKNKNWLYLTLLTQMVKIYSSEENYIQAKKMCEKILNVEPAYKYVKNHLYPEILEKV